MEEEEKRRNVEEKGKARDGVRERSMGKGGI